MKHSLILEKKGSNILPLDRLKENTVSEIKSGQEALQFKLAENKLNFPDISSGGEKKVEKKKENIKKEVRRLTREPLAEFNDRSLTLEKHELKRGNLIVLIALMFISCFLSPLIISDCISGSLELTLGVIYQVNFVNTVFMLLYRFGLILGLVSVLSYLYFLKMKRSNHQGWAHGVSTALSKVFRKRGVKHGHSESKKKEKRKAFIYLILFGANFAWMIIMISFMGNIAISPNNSTLIGPLLFITVLGPSISFLAAFRRPIADFISSFDKSGTSSRSKRSYATPAVTMFMLVFLIGMPLVFAVNTVDGIEAPQIDFALVDNDSRIMGSVDLTSLKYEPSPAEIGNISFNGQLIVRYSAFVPTRESARIHFQIIPNNISTTDNRQLREFYDIPTALISSGNHENETIAINLDELNLSPGSYNLNYWYSLNSWFSMRQSAMQSFQFTLDKDTLSIHPNNPFGNDFNYGCVYTYDISTGGDPKFKTVYNGRVSDSLNQSINQMPVDLYLEIDDKYELIASVMTDSSGTFYHEHIFGGSFETNSMALVSIAGNMSFLPANLEEFAGLEEIIGGSRFFYDADGDLWPEWPFNVQDLLNALRVSITLPDLAFLAEMDENEGLIALDTAGGLEGMLMEDVQWTEGKVGAGLFFNEQESYISSIVKNIETIEVDLGWCESKKSVLLSEISNTDNCVPFLTQSISSFTSDEPDNILLDLYFEDGSITVERRRKFGAISATISIVEFWENKVNVQQGQFDFTGLTEEKIIEPVDLAKSAVLSYYKFEYIPKIPWLQFLPFFHCDDWDAYSVMTSFADDHAIKWERKDSAGDVSGHYYIFEALGDEQLSVQSINIPLTDSETLIEINPVDPSKTFLLASSMTLTPNDNSDSGSCIVSLEDATHVKAQRYGTKYGADLHVFVIEFKGSENVQRGNLHYDPFVKTAVAEINPVNLEDSMIITTMVGGRISASQRGSFDVMRAWQELTFIDEDTIQGETYSWVHEATGNFEVVEWDIPEINPGHVNFGDQLNDVFSEENNEFVITAWVSPSELSEEKTDNGVSNCFFSKTSANGDDIVELGISENGALMMYLNVYNTEAVGIYGDAQAISLDGWTYIAIRMDQGNVDAYIGDSWYLSANGAEAEPWQGSLGIKTALETNLILGLSEDSNNAFYKGALDVVSVFRTAISNEEIEEHESHGMLSIEARAFREKNEFETEDWIQITEGELVSGYINFECLATISAGNYIDIYELYLSPILPDPLNNMEQWFQISSCSQDPEQEIYNYITDIRNIPDGDYYYILKATSNKDAVIYDVFDLDDVPIKFLNK